MSAASRFQAGGVRAVRVGSPAGAARPRSRAAAQPRPSLGGAAPPPHSLFRHAVVLQCEQDGVGEDAQQEEVVEGRGFHHQPDAVPEPHPLAHHA